MGERYEWAFHQRRYIGMTKKHRNRCSTSLILREVQNHNEISLFQVTTKCLIENEDSISK